MRIGKLFAAMGKAGLLVSLLAGCLGGPPVTQVTVTVLPEASATTQATPSPSPSPTRAPTATRTLSPTRTPTLPADAPAQRIVSGWTLYSNPNYVNGVVAEHQRIWAATNGGVVLWDLESGRKQLFTTSDGLVEIMASDVVYCPLPEERVVVSHEAGVLSVYSLSRQKWDQVPITFPDGSSLTGIVSLDCDPNSQRLVAGARNGLGILDLRTRAWSRLDQANGLVLDDIRSVTMRGLTMWVAAGRVGGFLVLGNNAFALNRESGLPPGELNDAAWALDGNVWLGYPTGLVRYRDRVWTPYSATTTRGIPFQSVDHVEIGANGEIWIASATEGVCPFDSQRLLCPIIYPDPPNFPFTALSTNEFGTVAGTAGDGVRLLADEIVQRLAFETDQLASNQVFDFAEDAQGRLWLATSRGVNILDPAQPDQPWEHIPPQGNRLLSASVGGLQPVVDGMWFTYQRQRQASFFDGQAWRQLDQVRGLAGEVLDTAVDQRGYIWFATDQGVFIWDGISMRSFSSADTGLPTDRFQSLLAQDGSMWVGTDQGLLRYNRFTWETMLPGISVQKIAPDMAGGLLIGTDRGLIRYRDGQYFFWIINLGEEAYLSPNVTSIAIDRQGNIWVGSDGSGLFLFDGQRWQHFTTANGLPANRVQAVYVDRLGGVWIATVVGASGGAVVRFMP